MSLSKSAEELVEKLRMLSAAPVQVVVGTVKLQSVDLVNLHCIVTLMDETEIPEVRLKAAVDQITDGIVEIPKDGSTVLVGLIGNDKNTRFVIAVSEVEGIVMYNGLNGGMVKVNPVLSKINALENKVNALITYINAHVHAGNGVVPAPPFSGGALTVTMLNELENIKVKH